MTAPGYTFRVDEAETARFRAMADNAERHELGLWVRAGIVPGVTIVDLGCGPGALLPLLADRVGPAGTIIGVDGDPAAYAVVSRAFATRDEVSRWRKAMEFRRTAGPLRCSLTMATVLATPNLRRT